MEKEITKHEEQLPVANPTTGLVTGLASNITAQDLKLPRIELTQALSPVVVEGKAAVGRLINSLTKEELKAPVTITPVFAFKNIIRWKPRSEGGGIVYRTMEVTEDVAEDLRWHGDEKPKATAYINVVCIVDSSDMPLLVSFCNTSYTAGQKLITLMQLSGGTWMHKYTLEARRRTNNFGPFFVLDVERGEKTTPEERQAAAALFKQVRSMSIDTDYEGDTSSDELVAGQSNQPLNNQDGL